MNSLEVSPDTPLVPALAAVIFHPINWILVPWFKVLSFCDKAGQCGLVSPSFVVPTDPIEEVTIH